MTEKPDAGDIVDQMAVPILPDDTALDVFRKVTVAAEITLHRSLPALLDGTAPHRPQDLAGGNYCGGRKPEDGRIDWRLPAACIHNLVRGVAPPYPGAYTRLQGSTLRILRTRLETSPRSELAPALYTDGDGCFAVCGDGGMLRLLAMELDGAAFTAADFHGRFGAQPVSLELTP
jgi:methionyl-tRNA formyltransferase